jgi:benzoylformate decarboxylase
LIGTTLPGLDFVGLAKALGCAGARVERADDLKEALAEALRSATPFVLDVAIAT